MWKDLAEPAGGRGLWKIAEPTALRWRRLSCGTWLVPHSVFLRSLPCLGELTVLPRCPVCSQPRAEAAGLEGAGLEGEAQRRTLTWNQVSTLPFLMDSKGEPGPGARGVVAGNAPVLQGQS